MSPVEPCFNGKPEPDPLLGEPLPISFCPCSIANLSVYSQPACRLELDYSIVSSFAGNTINVAGIISFLTQGSLNDLDFAGQTVPGSISNLAIYR